jgi:glycosyltransferase involved in cell wall biosynthesis
VADADVGVVIAARNGAEYIGEALDSALTQVPRPVDVVVVDDGSTDDTVSVVLGYSSPVRCIQQARLGPAAARNAGVAAVATDLVSFLDADDMWAANSLAVRLRALADEPELDAVFGGMQRFTGESPASAPEPGWVLGAMLARRSVFDIVGPLPEHRRGGDFMEWLMLARRAGLTLKMLPETVLLRRAHGANMTRVEADQMNRDYLSIVRAELARKRAAQTD